MTSWLSPVELVGYLASALIVASLAMTSVVRLRAISLVGSVTFVVYGALIGSIPIIVTNAAIAALNVHFLRRELGRRRDLGAVPIDPDAPFLLDFLRSHARDIRRSQPEFDLGPEGLARETFALLLTRDHLPAGAVVGRRLGVDEGGNTADGRGETLHVDLDYVMPAYRDSRIGTWLFGEGSDVFSDAGIRRLVTPSGTPVHQGYLTRMGFRPAGAVWERTLG